MIAAMSDVAGAPPSISSTSCGIAATASRITATISGERGSVWLMTRFSSDSMLQENSPMRCAPTMRPLPFSVWKARRRSRSDSASSGFCSHCGNSAAEPRDVLACLLDEQRQELRVGARGRGRRRGARRQPPAQRPVPARCVDRSGAIPGAAGVAGSVGRPRLAQRDDPRARGLDLGQPGLGRVEHLPLVGAAGLQRLHVVLDGDDGVGQPLEPRRRQRLLVGPHDAAERATDALHHFDGALLAEHQQARP